MPQQMWGLPLLLNKSPTVQLNPPLLFQVVPTVVLSLWSSNSCTGDGCFRQRLPVQEHAHRLDSQPSGVRGLCFPQLSLGHPQLTGADPTQIPGPQIYWLRSSVPGRPGNSHLAIALCDCCILRLEEPLDLLTHAAKLTKALKEPLGFSTAAPHTARGGHGWLLCCPLCSQGPCLTNLASLKCDFPLRPSFHPVENGGTSPCSFFPLTVFLACCLSPNQGKSFCHFCASSSLPRWGAWWASSVWKDNAVGGESGRVGGWFQKAARILVILHFSHNL